MSTQIVLITGGLTGIGRAMAVAFAKGARRVVIPRRREEAGQALTKSVALGLARSGTRVNAVTPGPADTGMLTRFTGNPENKAALVTEVPMGWLCLSEELANPMGFLASEGASYITGHNPNVDGRRTAA